MSTLIGLWRGALSLDEAFWTWLVGVGFFVNLATSAGFLALVTLDWPWTALLVGYAIPLPYNLVALVGVWRSAARHPGSPLHAELARWASAALIAIFLLT
ncbi:MAG: Protein of unknown function (DUF3099) [Rhodobacteraceae bacterium HLUCCA12]|nr:MAG: Protein of unknown function (DUF3099) [Rhodobacteraceae bacterium HLUCCA12]